MTLKEAIKAMQAESCYGCTYGCGDAPHCPAEDCELAEASRLAIRSLEAWEKLKAGVYKLHPATRGDSDYKNGVYDGECYVINYVTDFIKMHLSEVEGENEPM